MPRCPGFRHTRSSYPHKQDNHMNPPRIITMLLAVMFGSAGISEAAVIRRPTDDAAPLTQKMDQRPVAFGSAAGATDDSAAELMKKKKKKKKKKKSRAS